MSKFALVRSNRSEQPMTVSVVKKEGFDFTNYRLLCTVPDKAWDEEWVWKDDLALYQKARNRFGEVHK